MAIFFVFYFIFLALVLVYAAVNVYHVVRFRLDVPGDQSTLAMGIYIVTVTAILVGSIIMAIVASRSTL